MEDEILDYFLIYPTEFIKDYFNEKEIEEYDIIMKLLKRELGKE